jgi:hypothetical protein
MLIVAIENIEIIENNKHIKSELVFNSDILFMTCYLDDGKHIYNHVL